MCASIDKHCTFFLDIVMAVIGDLFCWMTGDEQLMFQV